MNIFEKRWYQTLSWGLAFAYMGVIFWLSSKPSIPVPPLFPNQDKVFHFTEYLGLALLFTNCLPRTGTQRRRFWIAFSIASAYGITDEIHQNFVPGRDCSVYDWLADSVGAWAGVWIYLRTEGWARNRKKAQ